MIRKTLIALAAVAAIGTLALAPTAASAKHFGGHHGHHGHGFWGFGFGGDYTYDGCYWVKQPTRYGYQLVQVCS
jgi:Spy/CpxP family protein refolding chaperone